MLNSLYSVTSSIYNYFAGYVNVKCSNCNRELLIYYKYIMPNSDISCSHGCSFELYKKFCDSRDKK